MYTLALDHLVVTVKDIEQAMKDYQDLGFRVTYGGKHASGTTHNALIPLSDGVYIELIAKTGEAPTNTEVEDFSSFFDSGYGAVGYALHTTDLDEDVADMKARGVPVSSIRQGSRELLDGRVLKWRIAHVDNQIFPLFLQDTTPREWRVSDHERRTRHENGAKSLAQLTFIIDDLHTGIARYRAILGVPPQVDHHAAYFLLEDTLLHITVPTDKDMEAHLENKRNAPYEIKMKIRNDATPQKLDISKAQGLSIELIS